MSGDYVEFGSIATAQGPLDCRGTRLWAFWVEGDRDRISHLCDRVFEAPSKGAVKVRTISKWVLLSFGGIESIRPGGPYAGRGHVYERQVAFWVPLLLSGPRGRMLAFFQPYMWLDNPLSVATGREVYGYNKSWGWSTFPGERPRGLCEGDPGDSFTVDVYGFTRHDPETEGARERLLEVAPERNLDLMAGAEETAGEYLGISQWVAEAASGLDASELLELGEGGEGDGDGETGEDRALLGLHLPRRAVNQVFLKQFRAVGAGDGTCLQQITCAAAEPTRIEGIRRMPPHRIDVRSLDSHPLERELGVTSASAVRMPVTFEMDFTVDEGRVLWP